MLVKIGRKALKIKECRTGIRGLMFNSMKDIDGALIKNISGQLKIWMPFVQKPLDLFFLDKDFIVMKKQSAVPITLNPKTWKLYSCNASYCLEIKAGLVNAKEGDKVSIIRRN